MDLGVEHADPEGTVFGLVETLDVGKQFLITQQPLPKEAVLGVGLACRERFIRQLFVARKRIQGIPEIREIALLAGLLGDPLETARKIAPRWAAIGPFLDQSLVKADSAAQSADGKVAPRAVVCPLGGVVKAAAKQSLDKGSVAPVRIDLRSLIDIRKGIP